MEMVVFDAGKNATFWNGAREESDSMNKPKLHVTRTPKFKNEGEEAQWWASAKGRDFLKRQAAATPSKSQKGSAVVANLNRAHSVQIALRLPAHDIAKAREIADRKGIGYQTLLKMLVHEGLRRESRRH
jgi:predicted DNA binding CopG/RHH family protein